MDNANGKIETGTQDAMIAHMIAAIDERVEKLDSLLGERVAQDQPNSVSSAQDGAEARVDAKLLKRVIGYRRRREEIFGKDLFSDPGWDLMLQLFLCHLQDREITISEACAAADIPQTTALRWINLLVDKQIIVRERDAFDRRRAYIRLADAHCKSMARYFAGLAKFDYRAA